MNLRFYYTAQCIHKLTIMLLFETPSLIIHCIRKEMVEFGEEYCTQDEIYFLKCGN